MELNQRSTSLLWHKKAIDSQNITEYQNSSNKVKPNQHKTSNYTNVPSQIALRIKINNLHDLQKSKLHRSEY